MTRRTYRILAIIFGLFLDAVMVYSPNLAHSATGWQRVANYPMDEGPRQKVLHDTWNGLNGVIGDRKVIRKGEFFRFPKVPFGAPLDVERTLRVSAQPCFRSKRPAILGYVGLLRQPRHPYAKPRQACETGRDVHPQRFEFSRLHTVPLHPH